MEGSKGFEPLELYGSSRFQDERIKPDSANFPNWRKIQGSNLCDPFEPTCLANKRNQPLCQSSKILIKYLVGFEPHVSGQQDQSPRPD